MKPLITFLLLFPLVVAAQQMGQPKPTFLVPVEMKNQMLRGSTGVAQHDNDGMIGINGVWTDTGYTVDTVTPGGPAANAGIMVGDVIISVNGKLITELETVANVTAPLKEGTTANLTLSRNGQSQTVSVIVALRKTLLKNDPEWQLEKTGNPAISQPVFGNRAGVLVQLYVEPTSPPSVFLNLGIGSRNVTFAVDDAKLFLLDGTGQQLRQISLDDMKYLIQRSVAQNWKGGNYPLPPAPTPQRQYTISGVQSGQYTITDFGDTRLPDYNQLGWQLGDGLKDNKKLLQQAQAAMASWERDYFRSQSPVVPGELRKGTLMYWTGSNRVPQPPYRLVLLLTDPRTQKEEYVTFAFGAGADKIRDEIAKQETKPAVPTTH